MDNFYRENILDHFRNPHNFGKLRHADIASEIGNPSCGDKIKMQVQLANDNKQLTINNLKFTGEGCAISIASASMLTDKIKDMSIEEIKKLGLEDILGLLGITLTPSRIRCALLPLEVLHNTLSKTYSSKSL